MTSPSDFPNQSPNTVKPEPTNATDSVHHTRDRTSQWESTDCHRPEDHAESKPTTPKRKTKSDGSPSPKKAKTTPRKNGGSRDKATKVSGVGAGAVAGGWDPATRIRLFEAYQRCSGVKRTDVTAEMGDGFTDKQCREQWQRATGAKIRRALEEA